MGRSASLAVVLDRVLVVLLGGGIVVRDDGARPGEKAESPGDRACFRQLRQVASQALRGIAVARALGGLDQIGQDELDLRRFGDSGGNAGVGGLVVAEP